MAALTDTDHLGGRFAVQVTERLELAARVDRRIEQEGLEATAGEIDLGYQLTDRWSVHTGVRHELREDDSPVVPVTQERRARADAVLQVGYDSKARWSGYGFAQTTLATTGDREVNRRVGVGGAYRINDRLALDGEVSHGDLGRVVRLGTTLQQSAGTDLYLRYALGDEQADRALHARRGNLIYGARMRLSDSASVYLEDRYQHADAANGLTRAMGISCRRWIDGTSAPASKGTLIDRQTRAETERSAGGLRVGYALDEIQLSSAVEHRFDESEQPGGSRTAPGRRSDRTTWLFRNRLKFQMAPDWRLIGKLDHSFSDSSLEEFFGGGYTEGVLVFAYRPVEHDRLNLLAKYTYFDNVPTTDQLGRQDTSVEFLQKSHIASVDLMVDVTRSWSIGGKYAYRLGQASLDREDPELFDNSAHLAILRNDLRLVKDWEGSAELRMLALPDLEEQRSGALLTVSRYLGDNLKVGVGLQLHRLLGGPDGPELRRPRRVPEPGRRVVTVSDDGARASPGREAEHTSLGRDRRGARDAGRALDP